VALARPSLSVQPARLELPLLDPQVARELGIVASNLLDESLGVATGRKLEPPDVSTGGTPTGNQRLRPALCGDSRAGCLQDEMRPAVVCASTGNTACQFAGLLRE
jgi:hypothetical protein